MTLYLSCDVWYQPVGDKRVKRVKGDELTGINEETAQWLFANGSASNKSPLDAHPSPAPEPEPEPQEEPKPQVIEFPAKAATIDIWREFGKQHGIDIKKHKTKYAIRAAVEARYQ